MLSSLDKMMVPSSEVARRSPQTICYDGSLPVMALVLLRDRVTLLMGNMTPVSLPFVFSSIPLKASSQTKGY